MTVSTDDDGDNTYNDIGWHLVGIGQPVMVVYSGGCWSSPCIGISGSVGFACIYWSLDMLCWIFVSVGPHILTSTDLQILRSLYLCIHRSLDLPICASMDPQITVSLHPLICRSSDFHISILTDPQIFISPPLWMVVEIWRSKDPWICGWRETRIWGSVSVNIEK